MQPDKPQRLWEKSMSRRRMLQLGGSIGIASLLAACGQAPASPSPAAATKAPAGPAPTGAGTSPTAAAPAAKAAPASGTLLRIGVDVDPGNYDTRVTQPVSSVGIIMHVTEPLLHRDKDMKTVALLAESWEPVEGKGWRFKLRKGVKFHNGEDFNAESVKYTIDSTQDPNQKWVHPQSRSMVTAIDHVEIEDPYSVLLVTKGFSRGLVSNIAGLGMVPPKYGAQVGDQFGMKPVGTGRYRFVEYVPGSSLVMDANKDYWGTKAGTDRLELRFLKENATRLAALEAGEVKLINNVPPDAVNRLKGRGELVVAQVATTRQMHLQMQYDKGVFADKRLRHAINYAIDKDTLVKAIMGGLGEVVHHPWHPSIMGRNDSLPQYTYNPDKAKQLMAEAGKPNGFEFSLGSPVGRYLQDKQISEAIVQQLAKVGIKATLDAREWASFWQNHTDRKYDAALVGYAVPTFDPEWASMWFWKSSLVGFNNAKVKELFQAADATPDANKAADFYKEAQAIIWDDMPFAWLYYQPEIDAYHKDVKNWAPRADEYLMFWDATLS